MGKQTGEMEGSRLFWFTRRGRYRRGSMDDVPCWKIDVAFKVKRVSDVLKEAKNNEIW